MTKRAFLAGPACRAEPLSEGFTIQSRGPQLANFAGEIPSGTFLSYPENMPDEPLCPAGLGLAALDWCDAEIIDRIDRMGAIKEPKLKGRVAIIGREIAATIRLVRPGKPAGAHRALAKGVGDRILAALKIARSIIILEDDEAVVAIMLGETAFEQIAGHWQRRPRIADSEDLAGPERVVRKNRRASGAIALGVIDMADAELGEFKRGAAAIEELDALIKAAPLDILADDQTRSGGGRADANRCAGPAARTHRRADARRTDACTRDDLHLGADRAGRHRDARGCGDIAAGGNIHELPAACGRQIQPHAQGCALPGAHAQGGGRQGVDNPRRGIVIKRHGRAE